MRYNDHNHLCLEGYEFVRTETNPDGLVAKGTYDSLKSKGSIRVNGIGGNGRQVLIEYESLPQVYKNLVTEKFGDPYEYASLKPLRDLLNRPNTKAIDFFNNYQLSDGRFLPEDHKAEYIKAAAIMSMIDYAYNNKKWLKKELRIEMMKFWEIVCAMPETKKAGLPSSSRKLRPRYDAWKTDKYDSLISKQFCNTNRKKVDEAVENLIISLYTSNNKPYASDVLEMYERFLTGRVKIVDQETGELYNHLDFVEEDGQPIKLSKTTIWNIINKPINRITVDKLRLSSLEFNNTHRPHHKRKTAQYAFSKITMDDLSLPYKMEDGKRAWAYEIADVASGCIIGKAFARSNDEGSGKNRELFKRAMMDMFRTIVKNGWGMPAEIEVEHHISNTFTGHINEVGAFVADLLSEGYLFPFVRFCNPGNPQEKRMEHIIKGKKYQIQNKREGFQRRPFARLEANRLNLDKNKVRYAFGEVVANEMADIEEWNSQPHPNQKEYAGLTRWQVLKQHQNPDLVKPHLPTLSKYIGNSTVTSIARTFCTVQYSKYQVPMPVINSGRLNNNIVTAHYMADRNGEIPEVYLFQDDEYVCTAKKVVAYQEAKAEQTANDLAIYQQQSSHVSQFDASVKQRVKGLKKVKVLEEKMPDNVWRAEEQAEYSMPVSSISEVIDTDDADYWEHKAMEDL